MTKADDALRRVTAVEGPVVQPWHTREVIVTDLGSENGTFIADVTDEAATEAVAERIGKHLFGGAQGEHTAEVQHDQPITDPAHEREVVLDHQVIGETMSPEGAARHHRPPAWHARRTDRERHD